MSIEELMDPPVLGVLTDYWLNDSELRNLLHLPHLLRFLGDSRTDDPRGPTVERQVDEQMRHDPRVTPLATSCESRLMSLRLYPSRATRYRDVPQGAGQHRIVPLAAAKAGDFVAEVSLGGDRKWERYEVVDVGTLEVTQFDGAFLKALFSFVAVQAGGAGRITMDGGLSAPCDGGACEGS